MTTPIQEHAAADLVAMLRTDGKTRFYATFTTASPFRDTWAEIWAPDEATARTYCRGAFGSSWSGLYAEGEWTDRDEAFYPSSCVGSVIL